MNDCEEWNGELAEERPANLFDRLGIKDALKTVIVCYFY
jgi:hypothetical protein